MTSITNRMSLLPSLYRKQILKLNKCSSRFYHTKNGVCGQLKEVENNSRTQGNKLKIQDDYRLNSFVSSFRGCGYSIARTDVLNLNKPKYMPELDPSSYGLDKDVNHNLQGVLHTGLGRATTSELEKHLLDVYCGPLAVEFQHIRNLDEREWFAENFEKIYSEKYHDEKKIHYGKLMLKSQAFDHFLANKFTTVKRYGGEGAESAMIFYDGLFQLAAETGIDNVVMCMGHRGRLNLLTCLLDFPPIKMFQKMKGKREFSPDVDVKGDVLSHFTSSVDLDYDGKKVHVTMLPNPSHLEAANPVCAGKARARMQSLKTGFYDTESQRFKNRVLTFQVHGDAAFSGQGVVPETFLLANIANYSVGGTIHLIVNNQIGYTTEAGRGRSSQNCSDIGKMIDCPVLRVNADYPESIAKACKLAMMYRQEFNKDIIVDYICYRKWGHNELDEPSFTQPLMYQTIRSRTNIPDAYANQLVTEKVCSLEELTSVVDTWNSQLSGQLKLLDTYVPMVDHLQKQWCGLQMASKNITTWDTGVSLDVLKYVGAKSVSVPDGFKVHSTLEKTHVARRLQKLTEGVDLDWATGEILAIGSLLYQGYNARISGQDVGRGTFSQRHAMFVDQSTDEAYVPLNHMLPEQKTTFEVANSPLSEEAVMAFEYGVSIENPNILAIWEAQFGDFFNGAQIIIDTFITGGETKWLLQSALTLLLPHGMDGAGPEHSSCRVERFLQSTDSKEDGVDGDSVNMQVANPTTPAQYFHLLRRQMVRNFRKPLIVVAPKGLLRHPQAISPLSEFAPGTSFRPILSDEHVDPKLVKKVVFVSGKHYYTLAKERSARNRNDVAIVRLESLCPFPAIEIQNELKKFKNSKEFVWSQEEHRNQGAWPFVNPRFENVVGRKLNYCGREVGATPAVGIGEIHEREAKSLIKATFR